MDWFERLTGFRETDYDAVRAQLRVDGKRLQSTVNGKSYGVGELELVSLQALRHRVKLAGATSGQLQVRVIRGDVRNLHQSPEYADALFQVASQFNLLEMVSPTITPEDGVAGYQDDHTQGPACAIAAGAATIYRNYFAQVGNQVGQTKERQLDGLADLGQTLSAALNQPVAALWRMQNGYALCTQAGLESISEHLARLKQDDLSRFSARKTVRRHSLGCRSYRLSWKASPLCLASLLLRCASSIQSSAASILGAIRQIGAGSSLRGHALGRSAKFMPWQVQYRSTHISGRGCIWKR
jgi:hypothetical protein